MTDSTHDHGAEAGHFQCRTCTHTFSAADRVFRAESFLDRAYGQDAEFTQHFEACPACGSENIEAIHLCVECHEAPSAHGTDACENCIAVAEEQWDARVALAKVNQPKLAKLAALRAAIADIAGGA